MRLIGLRKVRGNEMVMAYGTKMGAELKKGLTKKKRRKPTKNKVRKSAKKR